MPNYVCTQLSNANLITGQRTCTTWVDHSPAVSSTPSAAVEYTCVEFHPITKDCRTWEIEEDSVLLAQLATITPADRWAITLAIAGFLVTVWVFIQIKRMLR